jgi:hypothetical protein
MSAFIKGRTTYHLRNGLQAGNLAFFSLISPNVSNLRFATYDLRANWRDEAFDVFCPQIRKSYIANRKFHLVSARHDSTGFI